MFIPKALVLLISHPGRPRARELKTKISRKDFQGVWCWRCLSRQLSPSEPKSDDLNWGQVRSPGFS